VKHKQGNCSPCLEAFAEYVNEKRQFEDQRMARELERQQKQKYNEQEFVQEVKRCKTAPSSPRSEEVSSLSPISASVTVSRVNNERVNAVSTEEAQQNILPLVEVHCHAYIVVNGGCGRCYAWECVECLADPLIPQKTAKCHEDIDNTGHGTQR
jgi:hypothetical protein